MNAGRTLLVQPIEHLRIKGSTAPIENAVKTPLSIAMSVHALLAIMRKRLGMQVIQYQSVPVSTDPQRTLFKKAPISYILT